MSRRSEVAQVSRRGYWREAEARVMVEAWRSGGETLSEFAARYGVDPKRIARWASRLERPRAEKVQFHPVRVVGVEPAGAPTLSQALQAGQPVDAPAGSIAADSLAPRRVGELMFPIAHQFVDRVALVDDAAIREAQRALWSVLRLVVEPGGGAGLAAIPVT